MGKSFAVIGDPIDHSLSPNIHNAAFRELDLDSSYIAYRIPKGELEGGIEGLKKIKIDGFNITIPHKIEMMKYLDKIDEICNLIGAVNTVSNKDGILKGYNTDMDGFLEPFKKKELNIDGINALLIGAGGAARAIVAGFTKEKAKSITIANRTLEKATSLSKFAKTIGLNANAIEIKDIKDTISNYDVIVNATSVGLKNESSVIELKGINEKTIVYDIVYMPMNTDFIKKAKVEKATIIYGYEMLLGQAVKAFEIWHDIEAPYNAMKKAVLGGF